MNIILRTRARILRDMASSVNDQVNSTRWPKDVKASMLNQAIEDISDAILIPYVYNLPSGFSSGSFETILPDFINGKYIQPQIKSDALSVATRTGDNVLDTWEDLPGWTVEPNTSGQAVLRLTSIPYTEDGRVLFWDHPTGVPLREPTLDTEISATATSANITLPEDDDRLPKVGFFLINDEWVQYAGYDRDGESVTLNNLVRGLNASTAAVHADQSALLWGIPADRHMLWEVFILGGMARLAREKMFNSVEDFDHYQFLMRYFDQQVVEKMMRYRPTFRPSVRLSTSRILTELE